MAEARLVWNPPTFRSREARYEWGGGGAEYAPVVYFGAQLRSGGRIPGRPWITDPTNGALSRVSLVDVFADSYQTREDTDQAFRVTANALADASKDALKTARWSWPGSTVRTNGQTVGSPRNIVDTGRLLGSQRGPIFR